MDFDKVFTMKIQVEQWQIELMSYSEPTTIAEVRPVHSSIGRVYNSVSVVSTLRVTCSSIRGSVCYRRRVCLHTDEYALV